MRISKHSVRPALGAALSSALFTLLLPISAAADTILFPVIAVNTPNVTSIVSVINGPGGGTSSTSTLTYRHKASLIGGEPNTQGICSSVILSTRTIPDGDIVSFDASGLFNGGKALFNDTNNGTDSFAIGLSGPLRAYLLVDNGDNGDLDNLLDLAGETAVLDIASGAAWGMKAANDQTSVTDSFGDKAWSSLPIEGTDMRRFSFPPLNVWTTRFFVTPIGGGMVSANLTATVNLADGVYDRSGEKVSLATIDQPVTCTGAIDLADLMDSRTLAAVETGGGWSSFRVQSGSAVVYKLEYVVNNPTYGGTNNSSYLLSGPARP